MVFSSLIFIFFFLPTLLFCYHIVPQKWLSVRNGVLLVFSLFFYFYGEPKLIGLLFFSILLNYTFGLLMRSQNKKTWLILCIIINVMMLGIYKYLNFFIQTANSMFGASFGLPDIVMPIGISFYTFQALSYVIDVYRGDAAPQKNLLSLALYVSMFPQLIAGPIVRYHDVDQQITQRAHTAAVFSEGIDRFIYGLSKKCCFPMCSRRSQTAFSRAQRMNYPVCWRGSARWPIRCKYTMTFPAIRTWRLAWANYSVFTSWKTSIIRISAVRSQSSGAGGICRFPIGFVTMYISRWEATAVHRNGIFSICWWFGG